VLAAWPVWRSFFSEVPDIGSAPLRGQVVAALGALALVGVWAARYRDRVTGYLLPLLAIGFAVVVLVMAGAHGDGPTVDLAALAICWLAVVFLFAGAVLLDSQHAFAMSQGAAVPRVSMLLRAHERIGYWLFGFALVGMTLLEASPQAMLLAALAAMSPGAVLVWGALCDTARAVLARRRVQVADPAMLFALTEQKAILFGDHGMLIARRPKVVSIMPVGEGKPGEIVGIAAALLEGDDSDVARGVQDFGVSHRLRLPPIKPVEAGAPPLRRGRLPDRRVVEFGPIAASSLSDAERAPFAEQIARATEMHRPVLALTEIEPTSRLLGLLVLASAARPGAAEAVRTLRKAGFALALAADVDPAHRDAVNGLALDDAADLPPSAIGVTRPGRPPLLSCATLIHFGGGAKPSPQDDCEIMVSRDDPRTVVDLLQFARDFRMRTRVAIVVANLPGIALLAAALGHLPATPLVVTGIALAGIALAVAGPQALRLSPTLANEVDEE
jgi:cation transport ATPase